MAALARFYSFSAVKTLGQFQHHLRMVCVHPVLLSGRPPERSQNTISLPDDVLRPIILELIIILSIYFCHRAGRHAALRALANRRKSIEDSSVTRHHHRHQGEGVTQRSRCSKLVVQRRFQESAVLPASMVVRHFWRDRAWRGWRNADGATIFSSRHLFS